jgi:hypothetical protein
MSKASVLTKDQPHTTANGENFEIEVLREPLSDAHTYWLYFVNARHKEWGLMEFRVLAIKQAFPLESLADQLALSLGIGGVHQLLEEANQTGRPLYLPIMREGWVVM